VATSSIASFASDYDAQLRAGAHGHMVVETSFADVVEIPATCFTLFGTVAVGRHAALHANYFL